MNDHEDIRVASTLNFDSEAEVQQWVDKEGRGATARLRAMTHQGMLCRPGVQYANVWLAGEDERKADAVLDLTERATQAAEKSASHARSAWHTTLLATALAAAALVVSAWPFIKDVGSSRTPTQQAGAQACPCGSQAASLSGTRSR